jgi:hypothetical protein
MLRIITTAINTLAVRYLRCYVLLQIHGSCCVPENVLVLVVNFYFGFLPRLEFQCSDGQEGCSVPIFRVAELFQSLC